MNTQTEEIKLWERVSSLFNTINPDTDKVNNILQEIQDQEQQIKELKDDIEKIRHITYATFGEGWTYEKATIEQKKIADIDKIIYPKYYNSENENKQ